MSATRKGTRPKRGGGSKRGGGLKRIAVIGNYVPRRCGIATFTTGLFEAIAEESPRSQIAVVAMNDRPQGYDYPPRVLFEVNANRLEDYYLAANFIQTSEFDLVCVQHEYGIFGGWAGSHLLALLRQLRIPVVATLHTVLGRPPEGERRAMEELAQIVDRLIVMSPRSIQLLKDVYGVSAGVHLIHHGIPDVRLVDPDDYKAPIGASGRKVLLTFGLLSPGKGIEYMLEAMPEIVARHPDALYIVVGATHPNIQRESGETYRTKLAQVVQERGLSDHVVFQNEFVGLRRLFEYLRGADLYVTPYLNRDQAVSGTLAYALGTGKPIVSTDYWYAEDMLAEGRGRLVPPRDPEALARECVALLSDEAERSAMRERAYRFSRSMVWSEVAKAYLEVFGDAVREYRARPEPVVLAHSPEGSPLGMEESVEAVERGGALPALSLKHLQHLTDDTGILHSARYTVPDRRQGYTTDDNARALMAVALARNLRPEDPLIPLLSSRYLSFLDHAFSPETRRFRHCLSYDRRWLEEEAQEDSHGRAVLALGTFVALGENEGFRMVATDLFRQSLEALGAFGSSRALALALLGLQAYLKWHEDDAEAREAFGETAGRLHEHFGRSESRDWPWPEDTLTHVNARLPHALIVAGHALSDGRMLRRGFRALEWLASVQCDENGFFSPVGDKGWYPRGGEKARYDQRPAEANAMLEACLAAYDVTQSPQWLEEVHRAFAWFLGRNDRLWPLYDSTTGGCRDGILPDRIDENQGAGATLAWLLSLIRMHAYQAVEAEGQVEAKAVSGAAVGSQAGNRR